MQVEDYLLVLPKLVELQRTLSQNGPGAVLQNLPDPQETRPSRAKRPTPAGTARESISCPHRDRGPNWSLQEMLTFIPVKREEYLEELDAVDPRDLMEFDTNK